MITLVDPHAANIGKSGRGECTGCFFFTDEEYRRVVEDVLNSSQAEGCRTIFCTGGQGVALPEGIPQSWYMHLELPDVLSFPTPDVIRERDAFLAFIEGEVGKALACGCTRVVMCLDMGMLPEHSFENGSSRQFLGMLSSMDGADACDFLCLYDRRKFTPVFLTRSLAAHPALIIGGRRVENQLFEPGNASADDQGPDFFGRLLAGLSEAEDQALKIRDLEERYHFVFENTSDFLFFHDMEGIVKELKLASRELGGFSEKDAVGLSLSDIIPEKYRAGFLDYLKEIKEKGQAKGIVRLSGRIGKEWIFEYKAFLVKDATGAAGVRGLAREVSEHFAARKALRESEEKYRNLFNRVSDYIYYHDSEGNFDFEDMNDAMKREWGYNCGDKSYANIKDYMPEEYRPLFSEYLRRVMEKGSDQSLISVILADGKEHVLEYKNYLVHEGGDKVKVRGIARDITDRVLAESKLRKSEKRYRDIFNNVSDFLYFHDLEGNFNFEECNFMVKENWVKGTDEKVRNIREVMPERFQPYFGEYLRRIVENGKDEGPMVVVGTDGLEHVIEYKNALVLDKHGAPIGVRGSAREITDRIRAEQGLRKSEAKYRSILASIDEGYYETDFEGRLTFFNDSMSRIVGYSREEMEGMNYREYLDKENLRMVSETALRVLETGKPEKGFEWRFTRKDGTTVEVESSIQLIRNSRGEPSGFRGVVRDIAERKQAEALAAAKLKAEADSMAKSEFLANMSHEIRTPLNGIIGMTELALDIPMDAKLKDFIRVINRESEVLLSLINDILDFSKIEADKCELEMIPFDLRTLIEDLAHSFAVRSEKKGLEFISFISSQVPPDLMGDPGRLRQVITNLAGNALKFTEKGEVFVSVDLEQDLGKQVMIRFNVKDTGIGIPSEKQGSIFEVFTQADGSTTRKYGGTGLGLAISKRIVEMLGGSLRVESTEGKGSTFSFTALFPREKEGRAAGQAEGIDLRGLRVLVVDDNETNRFILTEYLTSWGCFAEAAPDGEEALSVLACAVEDHDPFDLVITDFRMPDMDGFTLARKVRAAGSLAGVPIILLSSSLADLGHELKAKDKGIQAYLVKPTRRDDLKKTIASVMGIAVPEFREEPQGPGSGDVLSSDFQKGIRILLAEDYPTNQQIAVRHLQKAGIEVDVAENGEEAVEAYREKTYDMILMDVQMPLMDGYEATRRIRQMEEADGRRIPIIAMTAHAAAGYREKCIAVGMDDYLSKPLRREELGTMVGKWIRAAREVEGHTAQGGGEQVSQGAVQAGEKPDPIDVGRAMSEFDADQDFLKELLDGFLKNVKGQLEDIQAAIHKGDPDKVRREAHSIKGGAANLCADDFAKVALEMEMLGKAGSVENGEEVLVRMRAEYERLVEFDNRMSSE